MFSILYGVDVNTTKFDNITLTLLSILYRGDVNTNNFDKNYVLTKCGIITLNVFFRAANLINRVNLTR